jgi:hypothetical protein
MPPCGAEAPALVATLDTRRLLPGGQGSPNRVVSIPVVRGRSDPCKDTISPLTHVKQLDNGARMAFGQQINKATAAAHTPRMANGIAHCQQPREIGLEIPCPVAEMLQTLVPSLEKIQIERGRVVALLDQLDLQRAGIRQRQRDIDGRGLALVLKIGHR